MSEQLRKLEQKWREFAQGRFTDVYGQRARLQALDCADELAAVLTQEGVESCAPATSEMVKFLACSLEAPTGQPARAWTEQEKADCLAAVRECVNEEKATIDRIADYLADARSCEFDPSWSQFLRWLSDFIYKQPAAPAEPRAAEGAGTDPDSGRHGPNENRHDVLKAMGGSLAEMYPLYELWRFERLAKDGL